MTKANGAKTDAKASFFNFLIALSCLCVLLQIFSLPNKIAIVTSSTNLLLSVLWFLFGIFMIINGFFKRISTPLATVTCIILFSLISFLIGVILDRGSLGQLGKLLGFLMLPIMLYCISAVGVTEKTRKTVLIANFIASLEYILLYHSNLRNAFETQYGTANIPSVTLGFSNPNQTATFLFVCLVLLFVSLAFFKSKAMRVLLVADILYISFILYKTDSRTAIVLLVAFIALSLWSLKRKFSALFTELCLLAPFFYMILALAFTSLFENIKIMGDSIFTGRENIYLRYFENLDPIKFLFGDFSGFKFENLHNGYISVAATVGIAVLILYYTLLRKSLLSSCDKNLSSYASIAYCGLLCIVIYTSTEAGFLVGGTTYAFMSAMMFIMLPSEGKSPIAQKE